MDDSTQEQQAMAQIENETTTINSCHQLRTKDYRHSVSIRRNPEPYFQQTGSNHQNSSSSNNLTGTVSYRKDESRTPRQKHRKLSSGLLTNSSLSTLSLATTTLNNHHSQQQQLNKNSKSNVSTMLW